MTNEARPFNKAQYKTNCKTFFVCIMGCNVFATLCDALLHLSYDILFRRTAKGGKSQALTN